ncbi:aminodeoxychorismate synthase component I [Aliifodinibius sp. S!AR15-10]|uniref:aminodeoxychorismate synthase component I n=1 Tax=Aliifodinibius sp. S!AR15-10 TaxID=2950437 RepID=UPI00285B21BC|nr:aminodeoxychorismate synthase component I [Aliifodinibius sp. S!AR15-10]MDR8390320.1 aminodeoxychorismate synthase component I [Aliifodinibius sp. S!AR15-10]
MKPSNRNINLSTLIPMLQSKGAVVLLESQSYLHPAAQKTYLAAMPKAEIWAYGNQVYRRLGKKIHKKPDADPWEELKQFQSETDGWLFGYLGYDLKNHLEKLESNNRDQVGAPDLFMMNPGLLIQITQNGWSVIKGKIPANTGSEITSQQLDYRLKNVEPRVTEQAYRGIIRQAKNHIREGNYYEVNLSHQMQGDFSGCFYGLYEDMKRVGPVPFGAYLHFADEGNSWSVCCASPERFLAREGSRVFSQPIKGTIHRGNSVTEDEELKQWLQSSEKNRAENLMIVDLVRNDLGRIAKTGSVKVSNLFEVQSFETVHQMVSTIEALVDEVASTDIIRACFPMGSMTGAPKISAMRSIEELEGYRRGIYSGAIGYLAPGGNFDFNVVIRTAVIKQDQLYYSVGGAITSDSEPGREWQETLVKAKALTSAVSKDQKSLQIETELIK